MKNAFKLTLLLALVPWMLTGCGGVSQKGSDFGPAAFEDVNQAIADLEPDNDMEDLMKTGMQALRDGAYEEASRIFCRGLRLDPGNGHLHFLNALTYHRRALSGDAKMREMAKSGYITTLKFDTANTIAAYLLGQLYMQEQNYQAAQNQFAYGLLYAPDNPRLLSAMAAASYYVQDMPMCRWAAAKAYDLNPEVPENVRNLMFSQAAQGRLHEAGRLYDDYSRALLTRGGPAAALKLDTASRRLRDWGLYYASADPRIFGNPVNTDDLLPDSGSGDGGGDSFDTGGSPEPETSSDISSGGDAPAHAPPAVKSNLPKMAHVDVVLLGIEENRFQGKGINIMDGLKTTLSGTLFGYTRYSGTYQNSTTTTIDSSLQFQGLEYNLNIFNDGVNKAEVLARPSLLATENATSEFFSGGELHVQLSSINSDGSMEEVPIGIRLSITPKFLDGDTVNLSVQAERSALEQQSEAVGFTAFSQTAKTTVNATAVLRFGQTLMLSGLSEVTTDKSKSGVPLLQSLPGVQYLFSRDQQLETKKSVLIFLTPRKARYAETMTEAELDRGKDLELAHVDELRGKERIANTSLNAAIAHLKSETGYYRQFRTGDMGVSVWENEDSFVGALKRVLGFLYY